MSVAFLFPGQGAQNEGLLPLSAATSGGHTHDRGGAHPPPTRYWCARQCRGVALDRCGSDRALDRRRRYGRRLMTENVLPAVVAGMYVAAHMPDAGENEADDGKRFPSDLSTSGAIKKTADGFTLPRPRAVS